MTCGCFSSRTMQIHAKGCCLRSIQALGQQTCDDACQHIARTACRHPSMACGIDVGCSVRTSDDSARSFEHQRDPTCSGVLPGMGDAVTLHLCCRYAQQTSHFTGVRR